MQPAHDAGTGRRQHRLAHLDVRRAEQQRAFGRAAGHRGVVALPLAEDLAFVAEQRRRFDARRERAPITQHVGRARLVLEHHGGAEVLAEDPRLHARGVDDVGDAEPEARGDATEGEQPHGGEQRRAVHATQSPAQCLARGGVHWITSVASRSSRELRSMPGLAGGAAIRLERHAPLHHRHVEHRAFLDGARHVGDDEHRLARETLAQLRQLVDRAAAHVEDLAAIHAVRGHASLQLHRPHAHGLPLHGIQIAAEGVIAIRAQHDLAAEGRRPFDELREVVEERRLDLVLRQIRRGTRPQQTYRGDHRDQETHD